MGCESNGGPFGAAQGDRAHVFALVIYIPDPLGRFLDDLRRELVPHYNPHAHVSVLPPRYLPANWGAAGEQARTLTEGWAPFEVELGSVEVFPATKVIYLEVSQGAEELRQLHAAMNTGPLAFVEPYPYHPHITLAQEVPHDTVPALAEQAQRRWMEYRGPRSFRAERAVFVQNIEDCRWIDLAEYSLGAVTV